jgi:hypothetical protein
VVFENSRKRTSVRVRYVHFLCSRALDPDSLNPNPDTDADSAFQLNRSAYGSGSMTKNCRKKQKICCIFFILNYNSLMSKLREKPLALKRENPALQKMKFNFFVCLRVIFAPLDQDPDCESESGSRDPIGSGSTAQLIGIVIVYFAYST